MRRVRPRTAAHLPPGQISPLSLLGGRQGLHADHAWAQALPPLPGATPRMLCLGISPPRSSPCFQVLSLLVPLVEKAEAETPLLVGSPTRRTPGNSPFAT